MPRRRESFADALIMLPWPVGASLSVVCWIVSLKVAPTFPLIHAFTLLFAFLTAASAFRSWRTRQDLATRVTLESLAQMDWKHFEDLMAEVFRREGYRVEESLSRGADGGIDLRLFRAGETALVQCKRWGARSVGVSTVRETFGLQKAQNAQRAIVVTTSRFTQEAKAFARDQAIELIDGPALLHRLEAVRSSARIQESPPEASAPPDPPSQDLSSAPETPRITAAETTAPPACPKCRQPMVKRIAKRGLNPGEQFWGCTNFPRCTGIRPLGP